MANRCSATARRGRPERLNDVKRQQIIAILANGSSRRVAAHIVGCAHSTIARTAIRDRRFADALDAAEHRLEVELLRNIRKAASEGRYWRAAAWLIERKNPRDFGRRTCATGSASATPEPTFANSPSALLALLNRAPPVTRTTVSSARSSAA